MSVSNVSLSFIRKKSAEALFSPTRCGTQKMMFHSSSYRRAAKTSNENVRFLNQGREQFASSSSWRSYLLPIGVFGGIAGIGGGLLFMRFRDEKRGARGGECKNAGCRNSSEVGGPFKLISSDGRFVTDKDLQGKDWILIYFGYTSSPDVGPAELAKLAKAINTLDSEHNIKIQPVFVSVDPQRDTPSHLRAYLKEFDERIMGLTGPVGAVKQMANEYRVFFKKIEEDGDGDDYLVESSNHMYLMNPSMEFVESFGPQYTANQLSQEIQKRVHKTPN